MRKDNRREIEREIKRFLMACDPDSGEIEEQRMDPFRRNVMEHANMHDTTIDRRRVDKRMGVVYSLDHLNELGVCCEGNVLERSSTTYSPDELLSARLEDSDSADKTEDNPSDSASNVLYLSVERSSLVGSKTIDFVVSEADRVDVLELVVRTADRISPATYKLVADLLNYYFEGNSEQTAARLRTLKREDDRLDLHLKDAIQGNALPKGLIERTQKYASELELFFGKEIIGYILRNMYGEGDALIRRASGGQQKRILDEAYNR